MESIVRSKKECFFCMRERGLERHHCLHGTANRRLAEEDGLWVWLCPECHRGTYGIHGKNGAGRDLTLKQAAQVAYMMQGHTEDDFRNRYGSSYIGL